MRLLIIAAFLLILGACVSDGNSSDGGTTEPVIVDPNAKPKFERPAVTITPSDKNDYPPSLLELEFPVHPSAEVTNVGNALLEDGGIYLTIRTHDDLKKLEEYYRTEMRDLGWMEGKINIFQGADSATMYEKDDIVCRFIIIDEGDHRKMAVNMTKKAIREDF